MIAILPTIQAQGKSYHGFLFYENAKNGVMIWKRILNLKNKYHFPLTLNDIPAKKKAIVAVRTEIMNSGSNGGMYSKPLHYLSDSSLSQDLGKHENFYKDIHMYYILGSVYIRDDVFLVKLGGYNDHILDFLKDENI